MPNFAFKGRTGEGQPVSDIIEARSMDQALDEVFGPGVALPGTTGDREFPAGDRDFPSGPLDGGVSLSQ